MTFPSEQDFALFLFQLFILLCAAMGLGGLFRRLGQPPVVGEILAGVMIGETGEITNHTSGLSVKERPYRRRC
jgi:Kef-type K+ transport system membrane component KefB